jgi:hypothetical protein
MSKLGVMADEEAAKKRKGGKKGGAGAKADAAAAGRGAGGRAGEPAFAPLTDEEKNDLVSQEVEMVQAEIEAVRRAAGRGRLRRTGSQRAELTQPPWRQCWGARYSAARCDEAGSMVRTRTARACAPLLCADKEGGRQGH